MHARRYFANRLALFAAVAFAIAACWPEWGLRPIQSLVSQMRRPEQAAPVARVFFAVAAALCLGLAIWWPAIARAISRARLAVGAWPARKFWWIAGSAALLPRALVLLAPYEPTSDAGWYDEVAKSLARGHGFAYDGIPTAFRSPGYAYVLSAVYRIGGEHVALAWLLGAVATAVLLVSAHGVASRLYDATVARTAVLLLAVYPALVLWTGQTMSDLLFTAAMLALFAFALRSGGRTLRDAVIVGVAAGALTLVRTVGAGLFVVVPAMWWLRERNGRALVRNVLVAAIACAAVVTPWMVHNASVLGRFTIGTNGGSNFLVGNRAGASGMRDAFDLPAGVAKPCSAREGSEVACDDAMWAEGERFLADHPLQALAMLPRKLSGMYLLETQAVTAMFQGEHHAPDFVRHGLYGASQLAWALVAALVVGRIASWRDPRERPLGEQWTGWLLVAHFTAICLVFFGEDRYRLPLLPWFAIEACVALRWISQPRNLSISPLSSSSDAN